MYEIFEQLLQKNGVTAYKVSKETGIATATLTDWKKGRSTPKQDKLQKIADYFGVTVDYLMGIEKDENVQYYLNDDTREIAQEIFDNPELRVLFDIARNTSKDRLIAYANFLKELHDKDVK
jgi:transcriptional regulator with XRE-family HTH domain